MDDKDPSSDRPPAYNEMFGACASPTEPVAPPEYAMEFSSYPPPHQGLDDFAKCLPPPYDSPYMTESSTEYGSCHIVPSDPTTHHRLDATLSAGRPSVNTSRPTVNTVYPPERYELYPGIHEVPVSRQDCGSPELRPQSPNTHTLPDGGSPQSRGRGLATRQRSAQMRQVRRDPPSNLGFACAACVLFPPLGILAFIYAALSGRASGRCDFDTARRYGRTAMGLATASLLLTAIVFGLIIFILSKGLSPDD